MGWRENGRQGYYVTLDWLVIAALAVALVLSVPGFLALSRLIQTDQSNRAGRQSAADTYATMEGTLHRMSQRLDMLEQEGEQDRRTIAALSARVRELESGVAVLIQQLHDAKITPAYQPSTAAVPVATIPSATLARLIKDAFDVNEMNDLAQEIGINPEDIAANTATRRATALVEAARRRGLLESLIDTARELRPNGTWP